MPEAAPAAAPAAATAAPTEAAQTISTATLPKAVKPTAKAPAQAKPPAPGVQSGTAPPAKTDTQTATEPGAEGEAVETQPPELHEVVVNGKKERWTTEKLIREAQKASASDQRFRESAEKEKRTQRVLELLKTDPASALAELGIDVDSVATERMSAKAEEALLTPEQRELKAAKAELEKYKAQETAKQAEAAKAEEAKAFEAAATHLEKGFIEAAKTIGLETNPTTLELMTDIAVEALELGVPMTVEQIAAEAKERHEAVVSKRDQRVAAGLTGEALLTYLGPATVKAVLEAGLAKLKGAPAFVKPQPKAAPPPKPAGPKFISPEDWATRKF